MVWAMAMRFANFGHGDLLTKPHFIFDGGVKTDMSAPRIGSLCIKLGTKKLKCVFPYPKWTPW